MSALEEAPRWAQLETIRFAAVNRLCVDLGYKGSVRRVEPYSLRRATDGHLLLYCLRLPGRQTRSYRVDRIQSVSVTTQPFSPAFAIELTAGRQLVAPPVQREPSASSSGRRYVVECTIRGRRFRRKTSSTRMRPHKNRSGGLCSCGPESDGADGKALASPPPSRATGRQSHNASPPLTETVSIEADNQSVVQTTSPAHPTSRKEPRRGDTPTPLPFVTPWPTNDPMPIVMSLEEARRAKTRGASEC